MRLAAVIAALAAAGAAAASEPGWPTCTSTQFGYSIQYPRGWHRDRHCAYFDPNPFKVPKNSDFTGTAIEVGVAQDTWANVVRGMTDPRFVRTIARRRTSVIGRRAAVVETVATGAGLHAKGTVVYAYVILRRAGQPPLLVQATRHRGASWPARKSLLDRVVRTLRLRKG